LATGERLSTKFGFRPVLEANCVGCHSPGGIAPAAYDLSDGDKVRALAPLIRNSVETGRMPPWQAQDGCNTYIADLSLSVEKIELLRTWTEGDMPEGDPADFAPIASPTDEVDLTPIARSPDVVAAAPERYAPNTAVPDDYRCFVVDPGLTETRYMSAFNVDVDNAAVLHHVVMFTVPGDAQTVAQLDRLEAEDDAPGYTCYGGPRTSRVGVGMAWAPGSTGLILPENVGMPIEPGTRLVVQMHYNTTAGAGDDQSAVNLWLTEAGTSPATRARMQFIGNLPFEVPAGVNGVEAESCGRVFIDMGDFVSASSDVADPDDAISAYDGFDDPAVAAEIGKTGCVEMDFYFNFPIQLQMLGVGPHMHEIGQHIKVELMPVDDSSGVAHTVDEGEQCLVDIERWDFNWQRGYGFREPVTLPSKGLIRVTCRFDNSLNDEPLGLGEGTGDEMCLALVSLLSPL